MSVVYNCLAILSICTAHYESILLSLYMLYLILLYSRPIGYTLLKYHKIQVHELNRDEIAHSVPYTHNLNSVTYIYRPIELRVKLYSISISKPRVLVFIQYLLSLMIHFPFLSVCERV